MAAPPLLLGGVYYIAARVAGQSFILHQIRKMVGTALAIATGAAPPALLPLALHPRVAGLATPTAPPGGLLLVSTAYGAYNRRFGGPGGALGSPVSEEGAGIAGAVAAFKAGRLWAKVAADERRGRAMETWLRGLAAGARGRWPADEVAARLARVRGDGAAAAAEWRVHVAALYPVVTSVEELLGWVLPPEQGGPPAVAPAASGPAGAATAAAAPGAAGPATPATADAGATTSTKEDRRRRRLARRPPRLRGAVAEPAAAGGRAG